VSSKPALEQLLEDLELLSRWCWDASTGAKLRQELLPELRRQLQVAAAVEGVQEHQQEQQHKLEKLRSDLQQQWQLEDAATAAGGVVSQPPAGDAPGGPAARRSSSSGGGGSQNTTPRRSSRRGHDLVQWQEAVVLLVQDCVAALSFCSSCCTRLLAPACYSLAQGLFRLGRCVGVAVGVVWVGGCVGWRAVA
jgi:hypothetical protein